MYSTYKYILYILSSELKTKIKTSYKKSIKRYTFPIFLKGWYKNRFIVNIIYTFMFCAIIIILNI